MRHLAHIGVGSEAAEASPLVWVSWYQVVLTLEHRAYRPYHSLEGSLISLILALKRCRLVCLKIESSVVIGEKGGQDLTRALR